MSQTRTDRLIGYALSVGVNLDKRAIVPSPKLRAWLIPILLFVGAMSFAAVVNRVEQSQSSPFTIGVSGIGGCDWIVPG